MRDRWGGKESHVIQRTNETERLASQEQERERSVKDTWRCAKCVQERRTPDRRMREVNGGLCCAGGLQEFTEHKRQRQKQTQKRGRERGERERYPNPVEPSYTHYQRTEPPRPAHILRNQERTAELQHMTSTQEIRSAATRAADWYGWSRVLRRESEALEPQLVEAYISTPGADPRSIGRPPSVPVPEPVFGHFVQPPIDWERWNRMQRGNHGRFPSDMPEGPTAITPLKIRKAGDAAPSQILRKPVPCRKWDGDGLLVSSVEAPSSPLSPVSPLGVARHPGRQVKREMATLSRELTDVMNTWNTDGPPSPQPWRQHQDWREIRYR